MSGNFGGRSEAAYVSYQQSSGSNGILQQVTANIQKVSQNVVTLQGLVRRLGTQQDSESLRQQLHDVQHQTNHLAKETNRLMKDLAHAQSGGMGADQRQARMQRERLAGEFTASLNRFQEVQRQAAEAEKASVQRARAQSGMGAQDFGGAGHGEDDDFGLGGGMSQTRQILAIEQDVDLQMIQEREKSIKQLETDIMDVNTIFKDLGMLVHEQGETIDSIEANVESAHMSVDEGNTQLQRARNYQTKSRKKICILVIILVIVLIIVAAIIAWKVSE